MDFYVRYCLVLSDIDEEVIVNKTYLENVKKGNKILRYTSMKYIFLIKFPFLFMYKTVKYKSLYYVLNLLFWFIRWQTFINF